jgi:hypothetical protein
VLVYPNPPTPAVGSAIKLTYGGPLGKKHQDPTKFAVSHTTAVPSQTPSEALATAHANAVKQANYLIVTVPQLIFTHNKGNSGFVNSLLSDMADLARLQNGVLGYFKYGYWKYTLKGLISPGGGWASKLHPNFSKVPGIGGYVLIVGETEIIPAWTMSGFNRKFEGGTKVDVVDHSDHPYADAYGGWPPDLIVARIIGDAVGLLRQAVRASIAGLAYDRSHALLVSGLPPYQDSFVKSVNDLAGKLGGMGVTSKKIHWKDYGSDTDRLLEFRKWAPDRDLILYRGHGTPTRWSDGLYSGWVLTNSGDFGNAYPVVIALACNTGNYEFTGDYGIAEHFFDSNAAVYIGSTEISSGPHNDNGGKHILENWGTDKTIGWAFTYSERALPVWDGDNETWWRFWAAEYNLYGDPKYGAVNPPASSQASVPTVAQTQEPLPSLDATVPDYQVDTVDGVDHVEIPGGKTLLEEGRPQVPYYAVTVDYPLGYKVQDVNLTDKSGLTVTTGLNIPLTTMIPDGSSADASSSPLAEGGDWYPKGAYDWRAFDNPDGSTTLVIQIYPFFYNALTTDVRFYRDYGFDITYTESHVDITSLTIDQDEYRQGDVVGVEIELDNADAAQDVIVSAWIECYSSGEIVDGLQLKTLTGLSRQASFSPQWDSAGFEPGYYRVVATVKDSDENLLDTRTGLFRLGISSGAITGFSATPTLFDVGDDIDISLEFSNTGTISVTGTAIIRVLDENGGLVQEFKHDIIGLASGSAAQFDDEWNASSEGTYTVLGYVQYDSHATAPATSVISTEVRTYLPVVVEVSQ